MRPVRELMRAQGAADESRRDWQGWNRHGKRCVCRVDICSPRGHLIDRSLPPHQGFKLRPLELGDFIITDSHAYNHVDPGRRYTARQHDLEEEPVD